MPLGKAFLPMEISFQSLFEPVYQDGGEPIFVMDQVKDDRVDVDDWVRSLSLKQAMDRQHQGNSELKARVECGRVAAVLACANFDDVMKSHLEKYGADYTALFQQFRYTQPLHCWTQVAQRIVRDDHPETPTSLRDDEQCQLAFDILARKTADFELINRIGYVALSQNEEIARKYADEDDLRELQLAYGQHAASQY